MMLLEFLCCMLTSLYESKLVIIISYYSISSINVLVYMKQNIVLFLPLIKKARQSLKLYLVIKTAYSIKSFKFLVKTIYTF